MAEPRTWGYWGGDGWWHAWARVLYDPHYPPNKARLWNSGEESKKSLIEDCHLILHEHSDAEAAELVRLKLLDVEVVCPPDGVEGQHFMYGPDERLICPCGKYAGRIA